MLKRLLILLVISACVVSGFSLIVNSVYNKQNNFTRIYIPVQSEVIAAVSVPNARLAGIRNNEVYFYYSDPHKLHSYNLQSARRDSIFLHFTSENENRVKTNYSISIFGDSVLLAAGNQSKTYRFSLHPSSTGQAYLYRNKFSQVLKISSTSEVVRGFENTTKDQYLVKYSSLDTIKKICYTDSFLKGDGGINDDGIMLLSELQRIYYLHYYNNRVCVFDTNLNRLKEWTTIDASQTQLIRTGRNAKGGISNISPEQTINKSAAIYGDRLFVLSQSKADNESFSYFKEHVVIDIYNTSSDKYVGSLYLPKEPNEKANQILLNGNIFVVAFANRIAVYDIKGIIDSHL